MPSSPSPHIKLVPWDHTSADHVARMVAQRKACGWFSEEVTSSWVGKAERGLRTMFWVALADSQPDREALLEAHTKRYPDQATPLKDTAQSLNLVPREASGEAFVPIGHAALNKNPTPDLEGHIPVGVLPEEGVYWISSLYISPSIQHLGVGRATMSHLESLVAQTPAPKNSNSEGKDEDREQGHKDNQHSSSKETTMTAAALTGTVIALDTAAAEFHESAWSEEFFWRPLGLERPKISNQKWYEKQGYTVFAALPDHRPMQLPGGDMYNVPLVLLKKALR